MRDHFKDVGDIVNIRWLEDGIRASSEAWASFHLRITRRRSRPSSSRTRASCWDGLFIVSSTSPSPGPLLWVAPWPTRNAANRPVYDGEDPVAASLALEAEILRDMPDVKERVERRESRSASMGERPRTRGAALPRFDATSCMSGSDIAYVIRSQMRPLETMDSYTDDYYCHKWNQRRLVGGQSVGDAGSSLVAPVCISVRGTAE